MALFFECMPLCAQKVLDTADIVRDAMFRQPPAKLSPKWMLSNEYGARMQFMRLAVLLLLLSSFAA